MLRNLGEKQIPYELDEKKEYHIYKKIGNSKKYYTLQKTILIVKIFFGILNGMSILMKNLIPQLCWGEWSK